MNRGDSRTVLRSWLQEDVADQWSDSQLNTYLNMGVRETQRIVVALDPDSLKKTYKAHIVVPAAGVDAIYSYPAGAWAVIELALSADGTNYAPMGRISLKNARRNEVNTEGGFVPWDPTHFALFPSPAAAVTNGLRAIVVPTLTMAVDTDDNPLPLSLHELVLKCAERYSRKAIGEPVDKLDAEIADYKREAPRFFLTSTEPSFVVPVMERY